MSTCEGIDDVNSGFFEIRLVAGDDDQVMNERGSCNEAVCYRHGRTRGSKSYQKPGPTKSGLGLPWKTEDVLNGPLKPLIEACSPFPPRQKKDSKANFAQDDRIDGDLSLVVPQPVDDTFVPR